MLARLATRRRVLYSLALGVIFAALTAATASADWPDFDGGPGQDRVSGFYPGLSVGPLWTGPTASTAGGCVVESGGQVFAVVADPLDDTLASLYAINESTGALTWHTPLFPVAQTCPAVDSSHVYVGEGYSSSHTPSVNAYNVSDGTAAWTYSFSTANGGDTAGPPTVDGSTVYITGYGDSCGAAIGCMFAFDASTGAKLWAVPLTTQADVPPVAVGSAVLELQRSPTPGVTALSTTNGATLWSDSNGFISPVADGTNVFYATQPTGPENQGATLYSRVASSGVVNWSTTLPTGAIPQGVIADGSRVLILISSYSSGVLQVLAYDEGDGSLLWDTPLSSSVSSLVGEFGGRLYTTSDVLDPATGAIVGPSPYSALQGDGPAFDQGTLFAWEPASDSSGEQVVALRDVTPPTVSLVAPTEGTATRNTQPTFSWTATDGDGTGIARIDFLLNGVQVGSDLPADATSYTPASPLPDGNYTWQVRAVDNVGNAATTASRTVSIDTQPPTEPQVSAPQNNTTVTDTAHPTFSWSTSTDATSGVADYLITIDGGAARTIAPNACQEGTCSYTPLQALADGTHTWTVAAVDRAGNASQATSDSFTVAIPPDAILTAAAEALTGQAITFSAAGSSDSNSTLTDYSWDFDGSATYSQDAGGSSTVSHTFRTPGRYVVDLRVRDAAGLTSTTQQAIDIRLAPPPGLVGVSINGGDYATNNPNVSVDLVWPAGSDSVLVSNDGGFGAAGDTSTLGLAATVSWTLEQTGEDRLPKTVYVRFLGAGHDLLTFTDDIILDETAPTLASASFVGSSSGAASARAGRADARAKLHRYRVRIKARDSVAGVCALAASVTRHGGTIKTLANCRKKGITRIARIVTVRATSRPAFLRVRNSAGTWSRWLRIR